MKNRRLVFSLIIVIIVNFTTIGLIAFDSKKREVLGEIERGIVTWSTYDFNLTQSIVGKETGRISSRMYIFDYLLNEEFEGLSYPYQYSSGSVYYTTYSKFLDSNCIIEKKQDGEIVPILYKDGYITYKKIYENNLFYICNDELRRINLVTKEDVILFEGVDFKAGFDINDVGELLFTCNNNGAKEIYLMGMDLNPRFISEGSSGRFLDEKNIVLISSNNISKINVDTMEEEVLKKDIRCKYVLLNPSKTHIFYIEMMGSKDNSYMFEFETLWLMNLTSKRSVEITEFPRYSYGIEWIDCYNDYYAEYTVKRFSGYQY